MATQAPPDDPQTESLPRGNRFFDWLRSLKLQRGPGWLGGVCAGVAARLDIDPLIVRGIVVVVAVLGGPAFLLYAAAWLLLPDQDDKIHLENLRQGKVESPLAGIGALVVLSMLPMAQGFWYLGASYWGEPTWGYDLGRALWTVVLLATVAAFVVWIARRANRPGSGSAAAGLMPVFSPATTDGQPDTIPDPSPASPASPVPPTAPPADASSEELAAWRARQELWKQQNREFRNAEAASQRQLRQQRSAEYWQKNRQATAEAAERRRVRRLENPALSAAVVLAVFGAAVVVGGLVAVMSSLGTAASTISIALGFAVAATIMGLAIAVGGVLRHRSGFLAFLAGVTLLSAVAMTAIPVDRTLVPPTAYGVGVGSYAQPFGNALVTTFAGMPKGVTDIWQISGTVNISVDDGTAVIVEVTSPASAVTVFAPGGLDDGYGLESRVLEPQTLDDGTQRWMVRVGDPAATDVRTIRVWQNHGYVEIVDNNEGAQQ